jgi:serine/threonine protein kinase
MSVDETYKLAIRTAILVHHLHRGVLSTTKKQYAHLDIKPKNIAIPHSEKLCFIDVRFSATLNGPFKKIRGTEGFLPIEALSYTKKNIDIFALLRVLYLAKHCLVQNLSSKGSPIILDERCADDAWIFHDITVRKTPRLKALLAKTTHKEQLMELTTLDIIKELTLARCDLDDSYQPYIGTSKAILLTNRLFSAHIPIKKEYLDQDVIATLSSWETLDEERIQTFILSRPSPMAIELAPKELEIAHAVRDDGVSKEAVTKIKPYLNNALFFKQTEDHRRNSMPCMKADFRPLL